MLILPFTAAAGGALHAANAAPAGEQPPPSRAVTLQQQPSAPQPAPVQAAMSADRSLFEQAVRAALERRSESRSAALGTRSKRAKARSMAVKIINTRATWYGPGFHGRRTASGEVFNRNAMTLASRHLPMGTRVRVVNPHTGRSAVARVNDRGPFRGGYTADLSQALARRIGLGGSGAVRLEVLPRGVKE
jgi:rare lipoprotein A